MRIVIIADVMDTGLGGMKTYADNLVRCIPEVDTINEYYIINLTRTDCDRNVSFISIPYTRYPGKFFIRKFWQVPKKIRSLKPDVVLETTHIGPFFLPKGVKRLTVIHDLSTFIHPKHYTWINRMSERMLLPGIIRRADHLITVSESTKRDIQTLFDVASDRLTVIPLGVEEIFRPTRDQAILDKYGVVRPYFLHVGTIQPRKNIEMLVDAYERFRDANPMKVQLVLVGKIGWKSERVIDKIKKSQYSSDIIQTGHVAKEELPVFYSMCNLFVFPSHYEGFGLPLLEALACGAACVSADNSSLREVGGDRVNYYGGGNHFDLSQAMINFSLRDQTNLDPLAMHSKVFSWEKMTTKTVKVLENTSQ
ncbi:MAG: glycosyltransferase family 1 protein [Cyclobacteriaceae bacterium]